MLGSRIRQSVAIAVGAAALSLVVAVPAHASPAAPSGSKTVNPSVGPCGTSSVHVDWGIALVTVTGGTVTDHCGAGTYVQVFITWNGEPSHKLGTAGPNSTASLPRNSWLADYPGGIKVTTCEHDNGWHCGTGKTL